MRQTLLRGVLLASLLLLSALTAGAADVPVAVSPGSATGALIGDTCPSFSWGEVEGAKSYELVVYRLGADGEEVQPVLRETFPGSAFSWTPSLDRCLERGDQYAWSVRVLGNETPSEWSPPSLFGVASGPSKAEFEEAVAVVRQYLEDEGVSGDRPGGAGSSGETDIRRGQVRGPDSGGVPVAQAAVSGGDSALQVNGSPVVTIATLTPFVTAALRCPDGVGFRYFDQGEGTILDCNTGLIWLKDANCFGERTWANAQADAASLASGFCGLTDGSVVGAWRQPTLSELCSAPLPFHQVCPAGAGSNSLADSSVGPPTVVNAKGDAVWSEGDAFFGVQSDSYWSSFENTVFFAAWGVNLGNGFVVSLGKLGTNFVWPVRDAQ